MELIALTCNAMIRAAVLIPVAIGLTMTYKLLNFANFAHVEIATVGAYITFFLNVTLGLNLIVASAIGVCLAGAVTVVGHKLVFQKLSRERVGSIAFMITSFGIAFVFRGSIRAIWGTSIYEYTIGIQKPINFFGANITCNQILMICISLALCFLLHSILTKTKMGQAMRAVSEDPALAEASGIDIQNVIIVVWLLSGVFAGIGGVLIGIERGINPLLGFDLLIPVFCVAILGGLGNPYGAMVGALILGVTESVMLSVRFDQILNLMGIVEIVDKRIQIPTSYVDAIGFIVLILVLLFMPKGVLGEGK